MCTYFSTCAFQQLTTYRALFNWLWPPIVQKGLDGFTEYWNHHKVRSQKTKALPSGTTPINAYTSPELYGGIRCGTAVLQEDVERLRDELPVTREEAFRWVSDEFADVAQHAYVQLESPTLSALSAWELFQQMEAILVAFDLSFLESSE